MMRLPSLFVPGLLLAVLVAACSTSKPVATTTPAATRMDDQEPAGSVGKDQRARIMALFMDATRARLGGDVPKAIQLFEACLKADPRNAAAMYELAKLYHGSQQAEPALIWARKAQATDKENIWYRLLLAELCMQHGRVDEAVATYRDMLKKWPDRYEIYVDLANALAYGGKVQEARQVYRDLEKHIGTSEELIMHEYDMLANAGEPEEARVLLERALASDPDNMEYRSMLAGVYDELGMHDKALEQYQLILASHPDDNMARIALAEHYYGTGEMDKAFEQLEIAFADPDLDLDAKMQLLLGFFEMSQGSDPDQKSLLQRSYGLIETLKQAHPQSGKPNAIHGDFLLRDGQLAEARDQFHLASGREKDKFPIWQQLVNLDLQLNDHAALQRDASAASELFPTLPLFHLYNGIALSNLKRHDEAIEALITGRDLVVDDNAMLAQFWTSLGDAYHQAGQHEKSDEAFERALALKPEDATALNNYAYFLSLRGEELERAEKMSRKSNDISPGQPSYQDTYAWVLFQLKKYADARVWIEKAIAGGGGTSGEVLEHYGDILFRSGDAAGAIEQWKLAQQLGDAGTDIDRKVNEGRLAD